MAGPIGVQRRDDGRKFGGKQGSCGFVAEEPESLCGDGSWSCPVLDKFLYDMRGGLGRLAGIGRGIRAVVVEDIDNAEAVQIDQTAADLKSKPGDLVDQAVGKPEECSFERCCSRADDASGGALHELMRSAFMNSDRCAYAHSSEEGGMGSAGCGNLKAHVGTFLRDDCGGSNHDWENAPDLPFAAAWKKSKQPSLAHDFPPFASERLQKRVAGKYSMEPAGLIHRSLKWKDADHEV